MMPSTLLCNTCGAANQSQAAYCRSCGHSLQAVKPTIYHSATGRLLANSLLKQRYRIITPVGEGGMGAVYKAEDTRLGNRKVALKEMRQNGLSPQEEKEAADAFRQEAIILARLQHPNLPSIFDHFEEHGRWYLVMSFIEGETLADYLSHAQGGKLPRDEALQIGMQLCSVLGYLHNQQPAIIFRDLKPSNIMRTPDGHIYLIDFGIARHFKPGQAKDTAYYGSMGYAPPEQYGRAQTTPRTDIYSLGVVLYQLLSGHNPSTTPFRFPSLRSQVPTVPIELATLITHMLELDEDKRPTSVLVVSHQLQRLISSPRATPALPTVAMGRPPLFSTVLPLTSSKIQFRRFTLLVGVLGIIIVVSGLIYFASSYRAPFGSNPNQTLPATSAPQPGTSYPIATYATQITGSPTEVWTGTLTQESTVFYVELNITSVGQNAAFQGTWCADMSGKTDLYGHSVCTDRVSISGTRVAFSNLGAGLQADINNKYPNTIHDTIIVWSGQGDASGGLCQDCRYYSFIQNNELKGLWYFASSSASDGIFSITLQGNGTSKLVG